MRRKILLEIICSLIILLFIYAGLSKLLDYNLFKAQLGKSPFIQNFASPTSWILPSGEILLGLMVAFKQTRTIALYMSLFLMTMFTAYIYAMLHYSYYLPCSCGGILSKMSWDVHFWFNLGFAFLSLAGILLQEIENGRFSSSIFGFNKTQEQSLSIQ